MRAVWLAVLILGALGGDALAQFALLGGELLLGLLEHGGLLPGLGTSGGHLLLRLRQLRLEILYALLVLACGGRALIRLPGWMFFVVEPISCVCVGLSSAMFSVTPWVATFCSLETSPTT